MSDTQTTENVWRISAAEAEEFEHHALRLRAIADLGTRFRADLLAAAEVIERVVGRAKAT